MSSAPKLPPTRILVAMAATVLALVVLGANALFGGDEPPEGGPTEEPATAESSTTVTTAPREVVDTTVVLLPDWYPKGSSRYSDRSPSVTITTLPPTTAAADPPDGSTSDELGD